MRVTQVTTPGLPLLVLLGVLVAGALSGCGDDPPPAAPDQASEEAPSAEGPSAEARSDEGPSEGAGDGQPVDEDSALGPSGGPGIGAREDTLVEALEEHIAALNALDEEAFVALFLDDCGDAEAAGALSYAFGAPLVEAGVEASSDFESITFLADDRARLEYATALPPDIWVVHERRWRISPCPE